MRKKVSSLLFIKMQSKSYMFFCMHAIFHSLKKIDADLKVALFQRQQAGALRLVSP